MSVEPHQVPTYEAWTKGVNRDASQVDGFLDVEIIHPRDHDLLAIGAAAIGVALTE